MREIYKRLTREVLSQEVRVKLDLNTGLSYILDKYSRQSKLIRVKLQRQDIYVHKTEWRF